MSNKSKKIIDRIFKIVLVIIIILLLIHNCEIMKKRNDEKVPTGNIDIIEITCDNKDTCTNPGDNNSGNKKDDKENKKIVSLSFTEKKISIKKGDTLSLTVLVKPAELSSTKLTWKSSDNNIVTVDANGKIKGVNIGRATITVTSPNGKIATCVVEVVGDAVSVQKIILTPDKKTIDTGEMTQISVKIEPAGATNRELIWSSSDTTIATVDTKGVVTGKKSGTVTITAKTKDGKVVGSTTITINKNEIESLSFAENNISIKNGDTLSLTALVKPTELSSTKLTWKSSDNSIVTVDENGKIKGVKVGKATITVTSPNGKTATCVVEVVKEEAAVQKIMLTPDKKTIDTGEIMQISAKIEPENATNRELVWSSSDTTIATVDSKGIVTGKKSGIVTITAKTKDGKVVGSTTITINKDEIESLSFAEENISIKKSDTLSLTVLVKPIELSSTKLTWKSSDNSVVTVDENGKINGVKAGKATITVTSPNGKVATCVVEVVNDEVAVQKITLIPDESTIEVGAMTQISAIIEPENATNRELVWSSSDTTIATVDSKGIVTGKKSGTVTITAKTKDGKVVGSTTITIEDDNPDGEFIVQDNDITWSGQTDARIFTNSMYEMGGVIAPEDSNTYQFVIKNSTKYKLKYSINFIESNPHGVNMKYKLKKNDAYIIDHYVSASELNIADFLLNVGSNDTYYLEWKWVSNDAVDTKIGKTPDAKYGLKIEVKAESTND